MSEPWWIGPAISFLTLVVLLFTLRRLAAYVRETKGLKLASIEQVEALQKPCLVVETLPESNPAQVEKLADEQGRTAPRIQLRNVGTGVALKIEYEIETEGKKLHGRSCSYLEPGTTHSTEIPRWRLGEKALVTIDYDSMSETSYRTVTTIKGRDTFEGFRFLRR
ncbi:MAG: hypothetical protein ACRD1B_11210 [Thermoanaerobaculia bacterium]